MDLSAETLQCKDRRAEGSGVGCCSPALASVHWYSEAINCQATSPLSQVFPGPKKTVGHGVYDSSPWSVHTHEYHKEPQQGHLSLRSPHGPGLSECKLVNECELSRWPLSLPESSGRQFRLGWGSKSMFRFKPPMPTTHILIMIKVPAQAPPGHS